MESELTEPAISCGLYYLHCIRLTVQESASYVNTPKQNIALLNTVEILNNILLLLLDIQNNFINKNMMFWIFCYCRYQFVMFHTTELDDAFTIFTEKLIFKLQQQNRLPIYTFTNTENE